MTIKIKIKLVSGVGLLRLFKSCGHCTIPGTFLFM